MEEAQVEVEVEADIITMVDMDTEIATGTDAILQKGVVHQVGLLVESSAVSSAAFSVLFSVRMEHAKDAASVANQREIVPIIRIHCGEKTRRKIKEQVPMKVQ